jgi:hypothetical protein
MFYVILNTPKGNKNAGVVIFDLADYPNKGITGTFRPKCPVFYPFSLYE